MGSHMLYYLWEYSPHVGRKTNPKVHNMILESIHVTKRLCQSYVTPWNLGGEGVVDHLSGDKRSTNTPPPHEGHSNATTATTHMFRQHNEHKKQKRKSVVAPNAIHASKGNTMLGLVNHRPFTHLKQHPLTHCYSVPCLCFHIYRYMCIPC